MTPQETQLLQDLLTQLTQVQGINKDPQASSMITAATARQPDAAYLLVQRTLLQDQALNAARAQLAQLQSQLQAEREAGRSGTAAGGGFLDPSSAWGNSAHESQRSGAMPPGRMMQPPPQRYEAAPMAPPPQYAQVPAAQGGLFGGGSFLGNMAATAAGVAGGAFLFQGLGSLMGHHGGSGLLGQNSAALPVENTTVNNFYGADNDPVVSGSGIDDLSASSDFGSSDDLGSADDMSTI